MTDVLRILVSPVAWLAAFSAVYGLHGTLCEITFGGTVHGISWPRLILAVAFAMAVLLQVALLVMLYSGRFGAGAGFVRFVSRTGGWVGLTATIWTIFPTLTTTSCA